MLLSTTIILNMVLFPVSTSMLRRTIVTPGSFTLRLADDSLYHAALPLFGNDDLWSAKFPSALFAQRPPIATKNAVESDIMNKYLERSPPQTSTTSATAFPRHVSSPLVVAASQ
jgi:hypothetical protein